MITLTCYALQLSHRHFVALRVGSFHLEHLRQLRVVLLLVVMGLILAQIDLVV